MSGISANCILIDRCLVKKSRGIYMRGAREVCVGTKNRLSLYCKYKDKYWLQWPIDLASTMDLGE